MINYAHHCEQTGEPLPREDLAASFTKAVCRGITSRLENVFQDYPEKTLVLAGGVAANSHVRAALRELCEKRGVALKLLPLSLCGDNGAMIGAQAYYNYQAGITAGPDLNADATSFFSKKN